MADKGTVQFYLDLVTSEHNKQPDFMAMVEAVVTPICAIYALFGEFIEKFDLETAVDAQLDVVGQWIGRSRFVDITLLDVFFQFDDGPGFDVGILSEFSDPTGGLVRIPDTQYRLLLAATAAANQWDGTIDGAYSAYEIAFAGTGLTAVIFDLMNMSIGLALVGAVPDAVTKALFINGFLNLRSEGVRIAWYVTQGIPDTPLFGFDAAIDSPVVQGFDVGAFGDVSFP